MSTPNLNNVPPKEAQVVAEHLPPGYKFNPEFEPVNPSPSGSLHAGGSRSQSRSRPQYADPSASEQSVTTTSSFTTAQQTPLVEEVESSLKLQGGDIHRDLFKLDAAAQRAQVHRRANTFHNPREFGADDTEGLTVGDQLAPGGFRRAFLRQKHGHDFLAARMPITRNFVEFLDLYGSFAGEDLEDSDEEAITDEEEEEALIGERRPLLPRRRSSRAAARAGTAGTTKTFFTLMKAFIGTGIMFLPKAFNNGGLLFSSLAMVAVSAVTMAAFHLLLQCKKQYGGGYGEIGQAISGDRMRGLILASITLSQLGFVCAGIVFVAENMDSFLNAVTKGHESPLSSVTLIAIQLVLLVPLAWIRNISKLGPAALVADACILVGVTYIYSYDISALAARGIHESVVMFNPDKYTLMIGSAIFTFEGIGLILPIQSSMAKPEHFEWLLGTIMLIITVVFTSVGALCYATFGANTEIEIINNFPQDSKLVNAVQFLYSVAVLVGTPVQLFPALRIIEGKVFGQHRSGKRNLKTKWIKNAFRVFLVAVCGAVSIAGTGNLDKFVALIGSVACVPLVYVYPAYLHYRGIATTRWARIGDLAMIVLGVVGMVYTSTVTIVNSFM
ncbi:transmembrane amino acid transporter protein-domain-containing protein [Apodospora peruviana]|uniref:Transmembrane amino acid transporter protein-domain-containing protein n=1 Tax=Apodospora peruviana TaxID=516989 RepID=A0AAE0M329_9PEZI|nr:transmembrane amino acid transporter protein-domain-containing protein [Apodospora peruviana]